MSHSKGFRSTSREMIELLESFSELKTFLESVLFGFHLVLKSLRSFFTSEFCFLILCEDKVMYSCPTPFVSRAFSPLSGMNLVGTAV